jgi:hypothetical protein
MCRTQTTEFEGRIGHGSAERVNTFAGHLSPISGNESCSEVFTAFWRILTIVAVASFTLGAVVVVVTAIDDVIFVIALTTCRRRGRRNSDMARKWLDVLRKMHHSRSRSTTSSTSYTSTT